MARPTLAITLTINDECTTIDLADTTANYGGGTVTTASVTSVVVVVRNKSTDTYFTYTFTVSSGTITAATLSLDGGTATNVLSELSSTAWPFITDVNELDLFEDRGVTLPDFGDAVYQAEYTISGTSGAAYSYTTSKMTVRDCDLCECEAGKFVEIDANCECSDSSIKNLMRIQALHQSAIFAAEKGMTAKAVANLVKAIELCDCDTCDDCG